MRYFFVCAAVMLTSPPWLPHASAQLPTPAQWQQIDAVFAKWTDTTPGCGVGISRHGAVATRAYGMADLERDVKITPSSIFESGSVAKQFTAAAVLLLAREGKLSLDDPVRKFIPELPDYGKPLTIRHALQHTAGLREWSNLVQLEGWPRGGRNFTNAHAVSLIVRQTALNFAPGTHWSYSNSGYVLAAEIVERVSGRSFASFSSERLFAPLKLSNTRWRDDHTAIVKGRVMAYASRGAGKGYRTDMPNEDAHGPGGLLISLEDMLAWTKAINEPGFFDAAFLKTMHEPAVLDSGTTYPYALGLELGTWRGQRQVHHGGATAGYRTHVTAFPEKNLHLAVFCNASNAAAGESLNKVAEVLLGDAAKPAKEPASAKHALTSAERDAFLGHYRDPRFAAMREFVADDKVASGLRVKDGPALIAVDATTLRLSSGARISLRGRDLHMTSPSAPSQHWERVEPIAPEKVVLAELAGRYVNTEVPSHIEVVVDEAAAVLRLGPTLAWPLKPLFVDGFSAQAYGVGVLRDAKGKVTGLTVGSDRMWNLVYRRVD
jgi:CubicO group peptidase (beta-lactamase class C family)